MVGIEEYEAQVERIACELRADAANVDIDVRRVVERWGEELRLFMTARVLKRSLQRDPEETTEHEYVDVPRDWWQTFKGQYFPEWLLRYFPVLYSPILRSTHTVINRTDVHICPHVAVPDTRAHLRFLVGELDPRPDATWERITPDGGTRLNR